MQKANVVIVGAGISGCVLAERYATKRNKKVLVLEKRDHIGGNCYDFEDSAGIVVPRYGPHFFHTNDEGIWNYVSQFTEWHPYEHRVLSCVHGMHVPVPVNINTINILFNENLQNELDIKRWLKINTKKITKPKNSEESALARIGQELYRLMIHNYTLKQWDIEPKKLDASVLNRIPVHTSFDDRYFQDRYQAMPRDSYTKIFKKMLNHKNIEIKLNTDYFSVKEHISSFEKLFFTGPIDRFFEYKTGEKLQYRSLRFEYQTLDMRYFQSRAQINYPNDNTFTRITEPKHATGQKNPKTTIIKEYGTWQGEPYYPVPSEENRRIYAKYQRLGNRLTKKGVYFVGRLANYKYFNMDQAFRNALDTFEQIELSV